MKDPKRIGAIANLIRAAAIGSAGEVGWAERAAEIVDTYLREDTNDEQFSIGEEVEYTLDSSEGYRQAHIGLILPGDPEVAFNEVRRKPVWKPKDGEAVFVHDLNGDVLLGRILDVGKETARAIGLKAVIWTLPLKAFKLFDASRIGKPWSEV